MPFLGVERVMTKRNVVLASGIVAVLAAAQIGARVFTAGGAALASPTTVSPTGLIPTARPTFVWDSVAGAEQYELEVSQGKMVFAAHVFPAAQVCSGAVCGATPFGVYRNSSYTFRVRGMSGSDRTPWSAPQSFTVQFFGSVGAGRSHSLATTPSGYVWSWGSNAGGSLGDGTTIDRLLPIPATGQDGFVAVAGGDFHTVALRNDSQVLSVMRKRTFLNIGRDATSETSAVWAGEDGAGLGVGVWGRVGAR
jgi:hypothetical protein